MAQDASKHDNTCRPRCLSDDVRWHLQQYFAAATPPLEQGNLYAQVLEAIERPLIEQILQVTQGNQCKAALWLGINRNTLRKKIAALDIQWPPA